MFPPSLAGGTTTPVFDPLELGCVPLFDPDPTVLDPELLPLDATPLLFPAPLEAPLLDPDEPDAPVGSFAPVEGLPLLEHATSTVPTMILATTSHNFDCIGYSLHRKRGPCRVCQLAAAYPCDPGDRARRFLVTRHNC
jgi:hypothetical protein